MNKQFKKRYSADSVVESYILFAAFDTETLGLGGELLAVTACVMSKPYYFSGSGMLTKFIDLILQYPEPFVWYAHNAQYDWRYILPELISRGYGLSISMRTDDDIYQIQILYEGQRYTMRDSFALFSSPPVSLRELLSQFCPEFPKLELNFDKQNFDPTDPEHIAYAIRDAQGLVIALQRVDRLLRSLFGVGVGHTAAGTAVNAWMHSLPPKTYHHASRYDSRELFIRQSYYGGLVFLTRTDRLISSKVDQPVCETYDINSSYPSCMRNMGVPAGRVIHSTDYLDGLMGIYRVRVRAPDDLIIPILPCRNAKGAMLWRRGVFETVVTSSELIFAANHGYLILEVLEGLAFEDRIFPFNDFISHCEDTRKQHKKQPGESLAKLMQNSLSGKFGSKRERLKIFHPNMDDDLLGAQPLEASDYFWSKKELDDTMRCRPEWSVFITAHARLKILQAAYSVGIENCVYGDTDSLTILSGEHRNHLSIGPEYGQFKLEKTWSEFRAIAPKVYSGKLVCGDFIGAVKGVSKKAMRHNSNKWVELLEHGHTEGAALSLTSLRVALSKGATPATTLLRKSTNLAHSQNWTCANNRVQPKIAA